MANREVVLNNLKLMFSNKEDGMLHLLKNESIGGNAGLHDGLPCAAVNFYYDLLSGEIKVFGNIQDLAFEKRAGYVENSFVVQLDFRNNKRKIVKIGHDNIPSNVKKNIDLAIEAWNADNDKY